MGLDHVDHFLDHVHVGGFQSALVQHPCTHGARLQQLHLTTGSGGSHQVITQGFQATWINELGDLNLTQDLLTPACYEFNRDGTVTTNRQRRGVVGDGDIGFKQKAGGRDQLSGSRQLECAVTGIGNGAVLLLDLEKAVTHDGDIQRVLAVDHIALEVQLFSGNHLGTRTQHQTGGRLGVGRALSTRLADILVKQVFKHRAVTLKTRGGYVG